MKKRMKPVVKPDSKQLPISHPQCSVCGAECKRTGGDSFRHTVKAKDGHKPVVKSIKTARVTTPEAKQKLDGTKESLWCSTLEDAKKDAEMIREEVSRQTEQVRHQYHDYARHLQTIDSTIIFVDKFCELLQSKGELDMPAKIVAIYLIAKIEEAVDQRKDPNPA